MNEDCVYNGNFASDSDGLVENNRVGWYLLNDASFRYRRHDELRENGTEPAANTSYEIKWQTALSLIFMVISLKGRSDSRRGIIVRLGLIKSRSLRCWGCLYPILK